MIGRLDDDTLLGPILAERYLSPNYRSSDAELLNWYEQYNNQPEAAAIYQLLRRRQPHGAAALPPQTVLLPEPAVTAPSARPRGAPDNAAWRRAFLGGIKAWRHGDIAVAGPIFVRATQLRHISTEEQAAGAYWAARASLRLGLPGDYLAWLHLAADEPSTFYGMLAGRVLDQGFDASGPATTLTEADVTRHRRHAGRPPCFRLVAGRADRPGGNRVARPLAGHAGQPRPGPRRDGGGVARRAGGHCHRGGGPDARRRCFCRDDAADAGAAPGRWLHHRPPLVYALTRTESGFNPGAASPSARKG